MNIFKYEKTFFHYLRSISYTWRRRRSRCPPHRQISSIIHATISSKPRPYRRLGSNRDFPPLGRFGPNLLPALARRHVDTLEETLSTGAALDRAEMPDLVDVEQVYKVSD